MATNGGDDSGASYNWQATFVDSGGRAQFAPAADNNKAPILEVLRRHLPTPAAPPGRVLEVASGTGQHVAHFAAALPQFRWQPSDVTGELFPSIAAHAVGAGNVQRPVVLDAAWPAERWCQALGGSAGRWGAVIVANMTHISPWAATEGLVAGAAALLRPGGILSVYGPFKLHGQFTTESNRAFHERLVASNPEWGYRDTDAIDALAGAAGLRLVALEPMPANNFQLIYQKG